jgi:hypothetical protein
MVNVRIIEPSDAEVVSAIVRATNRQTAINEDVLTARDDFQREVEDYCASRAEGRQIYFERRLHQYGAKPRSQTIGRRHLVQSYGAMFLEVPDSVGRYRSLSAGKSGVIFDSGHDPLFYYLAAAAYLSVSRLIGRGVPAQYRPARFHLLLGLKLLSFGAGAVQLAGERLDRVSDAMLDELWDPRRVATAVSQLLAAIDQSLDVGVGLGGLDAAVRTQDFTARFRKAVLELPPPEAHRVSEAA